METCISESFSLDLNIDYNPSTSSESSRSVFYTDPSNSSALDTLASAAIQMSQESEDDGFWSNNAFINEASNMVLRPPKEKTNNVGFLQVSASNNPTRRNLWDSAKNPYNHKDRPLALQPRAVSRGTFEYPNSRITLTHRTEATFPPSSVTPVSLTERFRDSRPQGRELRYLSVEISQDW